MEESDWATIIKIFSMIIMFLIILITGNIPIHVKSFKENPRLMSYSKAFSGGLFLCVGLLHLLPEANENFNEYYEKQDEISGVEKEHFPIAFLIMIACFSFVLFIERVATNHHNHDDHDHDKNKKVEQANMNLSLQKKVINEQLLSYEGDEDEEAIEKEEQKLKMALSSKYQLARSMTKVQSMKQSISQDMRLSYIQKKQKLWAPYLLQVAIGIHATFEGLSIGIETEVSKILAIAFAVVCHKWAEGLTLGVAFASAGVDKKTASIMILIQAVMNPIGIGIGWIVSSSGQEIVATFTSISAGTFLYIATVEVIVEEFSIARYKKTKFLLYLLACAFISSIWFIEQATGAE